VAGIIFLLWPSLVLSNHLREWEEGNYRLSYYREMFPAKAASFCFGKFESEALALDGQPRLEIHSGLLRNSQQRRHVAGDVANSLFLFSRLIAPYAAPTLRIVEAPGFTSQGTLTTAWACSASASPKRCCGKVKGCPRVRYGWASGWTKRTSWIIICKPIAKALACGKTFRRGVGLVFQTMGVRLGDTDLPLVLSSDHNRGRKNGAGLDSAGRSAAGFSHAGSGRG
jgi:hypothetical protein